MPSAAGTCTERPLVLSIRSLPPNQVHAGKRLGDIQRGSLRSGHHAILVPAIHGQTNSNYLAHSSMSVFADQIGSALLESLSQRTGNASTSTPDMSASSNTDKATPEASTPSTRSPPKRCLVSSVFGAYPFCRFYKISSGSPIRGTKVFTATLYAFCAVTYPQP